MVLYKFLHYLFLFCEKHHWYFDRNCVESIDCFGQYGFLSMLIISIYEYGIYFYLFISSSVSLLNLFL